MARGNFLFRKEIVQQPTKVISKSSCYLYLSIKAESELQKALF